MKKLLLMVASFAIISANAAVESTILKGKRANEIAKNSEVVRIKEISKVPNYIQFQKGKELPFSKLEGFLKRYYETDLNYGLNLVKVEMGTLGLQHYRYEQTVNNVPVELSMFIVHVDNNGFIVSMNGELFSDLNTSTAPSLTEASALNYALNHVGATTYKWQVQREEDHLKWEQEDVNATYFPKGSLVLMHEEGNIKGDLVLAYKFNIYAQEPFGRSEVYVNAQTGKVVWEQDLIHEVDVTGTATTLYSGNQTITCDNNTGNNHRLRETGRGNGIRTFTNNNTTNYSNTDITNNSNNWPGPEAGLDAHWGSEMTYDYFLNVHGRNSIDGNGFRLDSYVHHDNNYQNAFWDGQRMTYGDGAGNSAPLTSIDIAGHEITHGLTTNTANLVYQAESGALNESFSDIFGNTIERVQRPSQFAWTLGEDLNWVIRDMSNPNAQGDPDTYFGNNWASLTGGDNGGVHTNSGVQNYWYYLLADGGSGTNDNNDSYNISSIGMTKASQVAFRNLTVYLTQNSQYADARFFGIQSAVDLFGGCSFEVEQVTNAWYAVGVGPAYVATVVSDFDAPTLTSCSAPFTVNFNNLSSNGTNYDWDFGDGNFSQQQAPSHTYTGYGTFTVELIADGGPCGIDTNTKVAYITIDTNQPCISILPSNGTASTQTSCTGTIYDSGGSSGQYGANEDAQITIAPTGASTVDLTFVTFDIEQGSQNNVCDYDYLEVYDGPNTGSPLIGTYCNNQPPPATVSSTGGSITVVFHSDGGLEENGFEISWQCQMPNQAPSADFTSDVDTTCTGIINFSDLSNNGPTSWLWNFGDGNSSTQQNPTHQYMANGLYTVDLTATNGIGPDTETKTNYIYVNMPAAPSVTDDDICDSGTANLGASGSGTINWYTTPTGGTAFNTGNTYTTPTISTTTTYYVEDVVNQPSANMGKLNNTGGGANFNNFQYLIFDVYKPMELVTVEVYADVAGNRTIELRNSIGTVLQSTTVNIPAGQQTVNLNFMISPGVDYQLGVSTTSAIDLYRNNNGVNYPYTLSGIASITRSSAGTNPTGFYYFFYNWTVREQACVSPRTQVTATVNPNPTVTANATQTSICQGDMVTLTGSGAQSYSWDNSVVDGVPFSPASTLTYTVTGTDVNNCMNTDQITITVNICTGIEGVNADADVKAFYSSVNNLEIGLYNLEKGAYTVSVLNTVGQLVATKQVMVTSDNQKEIIPMTTQAKGMYFVNIYNAKANYTVKLVK